MSKKLIWIIITLVVLIVVLIGLKQGGVIGKVEGTRVSAEKAAVRDITETVNASGKIYPEVEVKVSPDVSGEIVALNVNEGDSVKRGQVLAKIYADIYVSQRDQVAAGVAQAKAGLSNSSESIIGLKALMDNSKASYDRQKKLFTDKVVSRSELDQAEQIYLTSQANYNAAREGLIGSKASIIGAQAQLDRADKDISRTTIISPMDGIVTLLAVKKGERVVGTAQMAGTEMMRVADMRSIEVRVDVGENDISKVKIGDTTLIEVDAYTNRKFKGIVYKIANPVTAATTTTTTTTEVTTYKVHIRLIAASYKDLVASGKSFPFRPGMSASADIQTKTKVNVLSVPLNAVTTRDNNSDQSPSQKKENTSANNDQARSVSAADSVQEVVFVLQKDSKVKKVKVRTGIQDLNYIEVLDGLEEGDQVITGPYSVVSKTLKNGNLVSVVSKDKLFDDKKKDD